jgi:hypothetical protein
LTAKALDMRSSYDEDMMLYDPDADADHIAQLVETAEAASQSIREKFIDALTIDPTNSI